MAKGPAMSREEAVKAIEVGIGMVADLKEKAITFLLPERWVLEILRQAVLSVLFYLTRV